MINHILDLGLKQKTLDTTYIIVRHYIMIKPTSHSKAIAIPRVAPLFLGQLSFWLASFALSVPIRGRQSCTLKPQKQKPETIGYEH